MTLAAAPRLKCSSRRPTSAGSAFGGHLDGRLGAKRMSISTHGTKSVDHRSMQAGAASARVGKRPASAGGRRLRPAAIPRLFPYVGDQKPSTAGGPWSGTVRDTPLKADLYIGPENYGSKCAERIKREVRSMRRHFGLLRDTAHERSRAQPSFTSQA
jgi:hypothetical protein